MYCDFSEMNIDYVYDQNRLHFVHGTGAEDTDAECGWTGGERIS